MELEWEDPPVPDTPFFTRDQYDKYSLAPNIRELWASLQSPLKNASMKQDGDAGASEVSCFPTTEEAAEFKDDCCISKEESCGDSWDSDSLLGDSAAESAEQCKDIRRMKVKRKQTKNDADVAYPEPRLPFPCMSSLSSKEQKMYLGFLMSKKARNPPEALKARAISEVMQFMRYLQDVSRICADDYRVISPGAMRYSEEFFRCCLEDMKAIPQLYQIYEMTSLTGGTFNPRLTLTFEKQLLIMGNVDITDHGIVPADALLASDYQSVSSEYPPAKKAKDMHAAISSDSNAERLCARYEPHVCLTQDALLRLLDNHGPDFADQWELPVWVKVNHGKGSTQRTTVYIDSPLLKTEVAVRERSHIFHEESLKLSIKRNGSQNVCHLMTERPVTEQLESPAHFQRNLASVENDGLEFEVDLTDLETFGEMTSTKTPTLQKKQDMCVKGGKSISSSLSSGAKLSTERVIKAKESTSSQEEMSCPLTDEDHPTTEETARPNVSEASVTNTKQLQPQNAVKESIDTTAGDSDDERLVIDDSLSPAATSMSTSGTTEPSVTHISEDVPECLATSSPQKVTTQRRQPKRAKVSADQLGEILRMQTAMFSPSHDTTKGSAVSHEAISPPKCTGPKVHSHPTSLVKPCVSSYLERNQSGETPAGSTSAVCVTTPEQKKILSLDLQSGAEDEQDYNAPEEGNLFYKLHSLQDLLLLVQSSISLTHSRRVDISQSKYVPVHVLPKLEYQLSYGVECLSRSEACRLWTETLLHSSTVSYIAHINAHTSKVVLLRKLPDDWKQNISCGFKPSKSLNILHHLLKKLTRLEEGRYLISHKSGEPFVTLLKSADGKGSRGAYNLQQVHSSIPQAPASGPVPWIPVDPDLVLPFHQKHGRVPCTFPPRPLIQAGNDGTLQPNSRGARQSKNTGGNGKNKQKKRSAKRKMLSQS